MKTFTLLIALVSTVSANITGQPGPEELPAIATASCHYVSDRTPHTGLRYNYTINVRPNNDYHRRWCSELRRTVKKCVGVGANDDASSVSPEMVAVKRCISPGAHNRGDAWYLAHLLFIRRSAPADQCVTDAIIESLNASRVDWLGRPGCEALYNTKDGIARLSFTAKNVTTLVTATAATTNVATRELIATNPAAALHRN